MQSLKSISPETEVDTTTAAAELGCSRELVTWLIRRGRLKARRLSGVWVIRWEDVVSMHDRPGPGHPFATPRPDTGGRKKARKKKFQKK